MKTFNVNGKEITLDDNVIELLREIVNEAGDDKVEVKEAKEDTDLHEGDIYYFPSYTQIETIDELTCPTHRNLQGFESENKNTLERAMKWVQLQNYADMVNDTTYEATWYFYFDTPDNKIHTSQKGNWVSSDIYFTSKELADQALEHFGEDFITNLLLRK